MIAAGVIARAFGPRAARPQRRQTGEDAWSHRLRYVLAATLVLYAIQASYSEDVSNAIENIGFFLAPFAVLFCPAARGRVDRPSCCGEVLVAVGRRGGGLLGGRASTSTSPATCSSTRSSSTPTSCTSTSASTRSSSTPTSSAATWRWRSPRSRRCIAWGVPAPRLGRRLIAVAGRAARRSRFSYSITSFAALLAGLGVVAILRWGWRGGLAAAGLGAVGAGRRCCSPAARRPATSRTSAASTRATST